jgi:hypothetical protein
LYQWTDIPSRKGQRKKKCSCTVPATVLATFEIIILPSFPGLCTEQLYPATVWKGRSLTPNTQHTTVLTSEHRENWDFQAAGPGWQRFEASPWTSNTDWCLGNDSDFERYRKVLNIFLHTHAHIQYYTYYTYLNNYII